MSLYQRFLKQSTLKRWLIIASMLSVCAGIVYISISYLVTPALNNQTQQLKHATAPEIITGKIVTLKQLREENFIDYHNMFSSTVRKNLEYPAHTTLSWTIAYLTIEMEKIREGKQLFYTIFDNKENKLIGSIDIRERDDNDPGQFGCWINEHYWGGGRFQEAVDLISKTYFSLKPHENKYIAHVRLWNNRSYNALKKYGFKDVGQFYEHGTPTRYILELRREQVVKK